MKQADTFSTLWKKYHFAALIGLGIAVMAIGLTYYLSPMTRLALYGVRLSYRFAYRGPSSYLVGWQSTLESWTEREASVDTSLAKEKVEEVSTLLIEKLPGTSVQNLLRVSPKEWILARTNAVGVQNQMIPITHPSIAPSKILLDKQGTLLERQTATAWRTHRALQFLVPGFPKGTQRRGSTWTDHLEWVDSLNDWKIRWQADVHCVLQDFEERYDKPSVHILYEAVLVPTIVEEAYWAKGMTRPMSFSGKATGEAYYSVSEKTITSNTFSYGGIARIPIMDLERVPEDLRVGVPLVPGPGTVILKFENSVNVQIP